MQLFNVEDPLFPVVLVIVGLCNGDSSDLYNKYYPCMPSHNVCMCDVQNVVVTINCHWH